MYGWELRSRNFVPQRSANNEMPVGAASCATGSAKGAAMTSVAITVLMLFVGVIIASMLIVVVDLLADFDQ